MADPAEDALVERAGEAGFEPGDGEREAVAALLSGEWDLDAAAARPKVTLGAGFLRWLLVRGARDPAAGSVSGLRMSRLEIAGDLDLRGVRLDFPLTLRDCDFQSIDLGDASLVTLDLRGSSCAGIGGERVHVEHGLLLNDGFRASGIVWLPDASVGGDLNCDRAEFSRSGGDNALLLDGARVGGRIFLRRSVATGRVSMINARVEGALTFARSRFLRPGRCALDLEAIRVAGRAYLRECRFEGGLSLRDATIGRELDLEAAAFEGSAGSVASLVLDEISVGGSLSLVGVARPVGIAMDGASVGGDLKCRGAKIDARDGTAIKSCESSIEGRLSLDDGFEAAGTVTLSGIAVGGNVITAGSTSIDGGARPGLELDRADISGNAKLVGRFSGTPGVNLANTGVRGDLDLRKGVFSTGDAWPEGYKCPLSLRGEGMSVEGSILANELTSDKGEIRLPRSRVGGDLVLKHAKLDRRVVIGASRIGGRLLFEGVQLRKPTAGLSTVSASVSGRFGWSPEGNVPADCEADLSYTSVGYLDDPGLRWPAKGLKLEGFTYPDIKGLGGSGKWLDDRLRWLRSYTKTSYSPQPYEQLIGALRRNGHEKEARKVAVARQVDLRKHGGLALPARVNNRLLGFTLGHGYRLWHALLIGVLAIALGTVFFHAAHDRHRLEVVKDVPAGAQVPAFDALAYSVDSFVPVVNLNQEDYRLPKSGFYAAYLWFHIAFGWVFTTLLAFGVTGLVRKE